MENSNKKYKQVVIHCHFLFCYFEAGLHLARAIVALARSNRRVSVGLTVGRKTAKNLDNRLWSAICFKIMTRYTCDTFCNHSLLHDIRAFFCHVYLRSFLLCGYKRAYICPQKSPYICVRNKHVVYAVTESRRIRSTELYRQPKTPSCTMELKGNFGLNQSWLQWSR